MNYADVMQRAGLYPSGPKPPFISGLEAAGVVESGDGVTAGSRVMVVSAAAVTQNKCVLARQIREAHELISSRKSYGKIVLVP